MREDLNKLLCERERTRSYKDYGEYRRSRRHDEKFDDEHDDEPFSGVGSHGREGMKHRYGWDRKSFSENLQPLYGFIHKSLGKKWDKVYSEICSVFDKRSVINQHILIHLFQKVEVKEIRVGVDGKLYHEVISSWTVKPRLIPLGESSIEYFVDPRDGVLKYNYARKTYRQVRRQQEAEKAAEEAKVRRVVDDETEYQKINGCWFEVKYKRVAPRVYGAFVNSSFRPNAKPYYRTVREYPYNTDVVTGKTGEFERFAHAKRQLSKKEIKRFGLS